VIRSLIRAIGPGDLLVKEGRWADKTRKGSSLKFEGCKRLLIVIVVVVENGGMEEVVEGG